MPIASGVAKQVVVKKESVWGTAPGASGAKYLRRVTSDLSLAKQTYESNEIRSDYQVSDMRHGVRSVTGSIDGELSPGSYQDFMASALRRLFTSITAVTGVSLTIASLGGGLWTVTRAAGDWLTSGFKKGCVARITAGSVNALNLNKNLVIVAVTSTVLTVMVLNGSQLFAEGPIASCTVSGQGAKTYAPLTGHVDESYAIEHFFSDVAQSELHLGCKVNQIDVAMPPTGMATIKTAFMGRDIQTATSAYYTSPTAASTSGVLAAVNGAVSANGAIVALLTGMNFTINGNMSAEPVVGSNVYPEIFEGRVRVNGQMTVFFQDAVFRDYFINETEVDIVVALSSSNAANADFMSFAFPRVKAGGASKNDGERGIVQTIPFTALLPTTGGSGFDREQSTLQIHDSLAV